jgi:hypothetical protein
MKYKIGDRDITSKLIVQVDKEGKLTGKWESRRGQSEIIDLTYERGKFTFKRISTYQDRKREMTFEGTIDRETDKLSGVIKSERGEVTVEGTRIGGAIIGTWNLESTSERGTRKQRLVVKPDMSGLYGALAVKKVEFEDGKVSFKIVMEFGNQTFEMNFAGKIEDSKLIGEMTSDRGSQKITGTKAIRRFRRRSTG